MPTGEPQMIEVGGGGDARSIATLVEPGSGGGVGVLWLPGFKSDMASTKASALADWARERGIGCARFDYSGHGRSGGAFEDGTVGRWLEEAQTVVMRLTQGPQVLIGSSMGGHIALLLARRLREAGEAHRLGGLLLIAPAWDMTEALMWRRFPTAVRETIEREGRYLRPSAYGDGPYAITRRMIEDGRNHLLAGSRFDPGCPVRILHGMRDPDVPWHHSMALVDLLAVTDVRLTLIKDGEHRLSRPQDLALLFATLEEMLAAIGR